MSRLDGLTFVEVIEPTRENATAIQRLVLQDLEAGKFPKPLKTANPRKKKKVDDQLQKLVDYPERYSGYMRGDELVAFIKHNEWFIGDELPFHTEDEQKDLKKAYEDSKDPSTGQWGIFALVASDDLNEVEREEVLAELLQCSFTDPKTRRARTVNVPIHDHDPLLKIVPQFGFVQVGVRGEASGAPGVMQPRYQRVA